MIDSTTATRLQQGALDELRVRLAALRGTRQYSMTATNVYDEQMATSTGQPGRRGFFNTKGVAAHRTTLLPYPRDDTSL